MLSALPQVTLWDFCALKYFRHFDIFIFSSLTLLKMQLLIGMERVGCGGRNFCADIILVCSSNMLLRYYLEIHEQISFC